MWSDEDEYFSYSPYYYGSNDDIDDSDDDLNFSFDDDYCQSIGSDEEGMVYPRASLKSKKEETADSSETTPPPTFQPTSLLDTSARFIAVSFPFAYVEHRCPPVPDELQLKIIHFSFPEDEEMIRKYAEFSRSNVEFSYATRLHQTGSVKDLHQIGFRLSASVEDKRGGRRSDNGKYYVTIHFDRGKVTSAHCSCDLSSNWCEHAIATCLARIKNGEKMTVHLPVSDSLNLLDREQLLKFAQYLLCEHRNEKVVESAQQLLDKLLSRQQKGEQEDINKIAGAPDPTAGPGLDEEAHWFVCKSGFKSRCESLMYESWKDLGFAMSHIVDNDRGSSVHEVWQKNCLQPALIKDEMDQELDSEYRYGYSSSLHQQSVLQILQTTADLLQDDYMSAVSALTMCTEQLIERLSKLVNVKSYRDRYDVYGSRMRQEGPSEPVRIGGSLTGGFTPRISSCRTLIDELSRLWRLAVLSPRLPAKQRQGIINQLNAFNAEAVNTFKSGTLPLCPWQGLDVALKLSHMNWSAVGFQRVLMGEWVQFPVVSSCMAVHFTLQTRRSDAASETTQGWDPIDPIPVQMETDMTKSLLFHNPHCVSFDPSCAFDIHSICSMIEALKVNNDRKAAVRVGVAVTCALVSFYKKLLSKNIDVESMPVSARCFLGLKHGISTKPEGPKGSKPDGSMESPMEGVEEGSEETSRSGSHAWPEDTIISVTTFAFLFDLLSQESDLVDACLVEMKTKLRLGSSSVKQASLVDCPCSAQALKFQLGVLGLFMHKLPAPSQHCEVEQFESECWLTFHLICCSPTEEDLVLLTHLARHVTHEQSVPSLSPHSSLARVIFHHLFKGAPAALSKSLTERQTVGLDAAFHVLGHVNELAEVDNSMAWKTFQYANCRLWAKLALLVLRSLWDSEEFMEKAMSCILKPNGVLGSSTDEVPILARGVEGEVIICARGGEGEFVDAQYRVAYSLAKSLRVKKGNSKETIHFVKKRVATQSVRGHMRDVLRARETVEVEMPRKISKSGIEKALNLCAVGIGAHSVWLQRLANRSNLYSETVRWLTDFAVNSGIDSIIFLAKFKGGVSALFKQNEVLDFCDKVLRKEETQSESIVQEILLSQLHKTSHEESAEEMKGVITFCREKRSAAKLVLLPWICRELQSFQDGGAFLPFEVLMHASQAMFQHYREKLDSAEHGDDRVRFPEGPLGLERLFNPGVLPRDSSEKEDEIRSPANQNPFRTPEAHSFLETAFELGMKGLEKLKDKSDDREHERLPYYRCPAKEQLEKFCLLVCYLVQRKWITTHVPESPTRIMVLRKDEKTDPSSKPGCSNWEDEHLHSGARVTCDNSYLHTFVCCLINSVENPLWLFSVLQELADNLSTGSQRHSPIPRQEAENLHIKEACQSYLPIKLLLQKDLDAFSKLLLGPKMSDLVDEITSRRNLRRLEPSEVRYELGHSILLNTRLKEVLKVAKRAFSISDSTGSAFMSLVKQMWSQHALLQSFLELVLKDKDSDMEDREIVMFPRGNLHLPALIAQGLFPGLFSGSPIDDYF